MNLIAVHRKSPYVMQVNETEIIELKKDKCERKRLEKLPHEQSGIFIKRRNAPMSPRRRRRRNALKTAKILSLMKKQHFITPSQVKNTLEDTDISFSKFTIKRHLHESKYRETT